MCSSDLVVVVLWEPERAWPLLAWLGTYMVLSLWRLGVLRRFTQRIDIDPSAAMRLAPVIQVGCAAMGLLWGAITMLPHSPGDLKTPLLVAYSLVGVTAGSATAMACEIFTALSFQFAIVGTLALHLLMNRDDPVYRIMGSLALLYA